MLLFKNVYKILFILFRFAKIKKTGFLHIHRIQDFDIIQDLI